MLNFSKSLSLCLLILLSSFVSRAEKNSGGGFGLVLKEILQRARTEPHKGHVTFYCRGMKPEDQYSLNNLSEEGFLNLSVGFGTDSSCLPASPKVKEIFDQRLKESSCFAKNLEKATAVAKNLKKKLKEQGSYEAYNIKLLIKRKNGSVDQGVIKDGIRTMTSIFSQSSKDKNKCDWTVNLLLTREEKFFNTVDTRLEVLSFDQNTVDSAMNPKQNLDLVVERIRRPMNANDSAKNKPSQRDNLRPEPNSQSGQDDESLGAE